MARPYRINHGFEPESDMARNSRYRQPQSVPRDHATNPAYATQVNSHADHRIHPNQALVQMKLIDHCDMAVINPFFHGQTDIPVKDPQMNCFVKADRVVINTFFGLGKPDYSKLQASHAKGSSTSSQSLQDSYIDQYPLHSAAYEGSESMLRQLLSMGYFPDQPDSLSWTALHYACWNGHVDAVRVLLQHPLCSPNVVENGGGATPLHYAASRGHAQVVQLLLSNRDIDRYVLNNEGKSPLQLCEEAKSYQWEETARLLREAANRAPFKHDVHLMDLDGSHVILDLDRGSNTLVSDLLKQLKLPSGCEHVFAIWIASQNLHLQMRPEHKPMLHLKQWDTIIDQLTNYNPDSERPLLYLRRSALLRVEEEESVKDPQAIKMLFEECLLNVLRGWYPCSDQDAVRLAGIYMQIVYGDHDPKRHNVKANFLNDINLRHFIPAIKLESKGSLNKTHMWAQKIVNEHKNITQQGIRDVTKLHLKYLETCRAFSFYGSAFFFGSLQLKSGSQHERGASSAGPSRKTSSGIFVGINSRGLHLIYAIEKRLFFSIGYKQGLSWEVPPEGSTQDPTFTITIQEEGSPRTYPIKTKQAAVMNNLANKLRPKRQEELNKPSTSRHTLPKRR